jgi:hypothetical protein
MHTGPTWDRRFWYPEQKMYQNRTHRGQKIFAGPNTEEKMSKPTKTGPFFLGQQKMCIPDPNHKWE